MTLSDDDPDSARLQRFVEAHPRLFVLSGAGCSTAAGLGDYRDQQGQWKRSPPITVQEFLATEQARRRYWARSALGWPAFQRALPANAHIALARLQTLGVVRHLVTQNVDRLHQRAGHSDVIDLHGALHRVRCLECNTEESRDALQQRLLANNDWLLAMSASAAPDGDADLELSPDQSMHIPACLACGGILKPDVVFFGENVPRARVELAQQQLAACDALLVVGSSLMVFSGFRFCRDAAARGQAIAIVNQGITRADDLATLRVSGDCGERLQTLSEALTRAA